MTGIEWTDATWNPVRGCARVSPGCQNCYAEEAAHRVNRQFAAQGRPEPYGGLIKLVPREARGLITSGYKPMKPEPRWVGRATFHPDQLAKPLRWKRGRRIFVNSMSDLFHDDIANEQIAAVFGVMAACPQHTFQILTKRPARMRAWFRWLTNGKAAAGRMFDYLDDAACAALAGYFDCCHLGLTTSRIAWPLPNVWIGVSVENQATADERIPHLLETPAALRFLSCEPLLGGVDLEMVKHRLGERSFEVGSVLEGDDGFGLNAPRERIDWVIAGCESGRGARPARVDWYRSLRDQCAAAGVSFFLKQASKRFAPDEVSAVDGWVPSKGPITFGAGSKRKRDGIVGLPYLDGVQHAAFPSVA